MFGFQQSSRHVPFTGETDLAVSVEYPTGEFSIQLGRDPFDPQRVERSAVLRTAQLIMAGDVLVPRRLRDPHTAPALTTPATKEESR